MSGGAGYVLSRAALRKVVEKGFCNKQASAAAEDVEMGKCLSRIGVTFGNSRDQFGRNRFFPFTPDKHLSPDYRKRLGLQVY